MKVIPLFAQKLPGIQENGLRLPGNVKIDGNPDEWKAFQACNNATDICYTMANDDNHLYLIVKAHEVLVIEKIIAGGITLTIHSLDKKDKTPYTITFPIYEARKIPNFNFKDKKQFISGSRERADSFRYANNKKLSATAKYIRTTGISSLDSMISVYNDNDVKAAVAFDRSMTYYYELSLPLKDMNLSVADQSAFAYKITVNAPGNINGISSYRNDQGLLVVKYQPGGVFPKGNERNTLSAATDFWGKYTLVSR